jgi:hypothetical protein
VPLAGSHDRPQGTVDDEAAFRPVIDVAEGRLDVDGIAGILGAALTATQEP